MIQILVKTASLRHTLLMQLRFTQITPALKVPVHQERSHAQKQSDRHNPLIERNRTKSEADTVCPIRRLRHNRVSLDMHSGTCRLQEISQTHPARPLSSPRLSALRAVEYPRYPAPNNHQSSSGSAASHAFIPSAIELATAGSNACSTPIGIAARIIAYITYRNEGRARLVHGSLLLASARMALMRVSSSFSSPFCCICSSWAFAFSRSAGSGQILRSEEH